MKVLKAKTGVSLTDALMIAGSKILIERALIRLIGNQTYLSGAIKLAGAGVLKGFVKGKIGDVVGTALVIDGAEDVVTNLLGTLNVNFLGSTAGEKGVIL